MEDIRPEDIIMEEGPMGPIGEGGSLILRVNRNCTWNRCSFCSVYKRAMFSARDVRDIKRDVDAVRRIRDMLEVSSWNIGLQGRITRESIRMTLRDHPFLSESYGREASPEHSALLKSLQNVANWFLHGGKRVFLQDANALGLKSESLVEILLYLRDIFPNVQAVSTYARSTTCGHRTSRELKALRNAGLSWCFVGIESGCDDVLKFMDKGVTAEGHVRGGLNLKEAGISMAAFVMPGLAGAQSDLSRKHMEETVAVLNRIQPEEVRVRSLAVVEGAPIHEGWRRGKFLACSEDQLVEEMRLLVEGLDFDCTLETLQMTNPLFTVKGRLFEMKELILDLIKDYQTLSSAQRAKVLLEQYTDRGYLEAVRGWGKYDSELESLVEEARRAIDEDSPEAIKITDRAVFALKSKGVP